MNQSVIEKFRSELGQELDRILAFWVNTMPDEKYGGFLGELDFKGNPVPKSPKGIILNTRLLWTFSAVAQKTKQEEHRLMADRAYDYLLANFLDRKHGGVFWLVDFKGAVLNSRKQIYAQAFFIYALAEYFKLTKKEEALELAVELFHLLEEKAADRNMGGYLDAFDERWQELEDMRLSEKDLNEKKILNTHLHLLEAYSTLYTVYPNLEVKQALLGLIELFQEKFVGEDFHLNMFFDEQWNVKSQLVSYGHDIETSWLLYEAGEVLHDDFMMEKLSATAVAMADVFVREGLDQDGSVLNERDKANGHLDSDRHWWPQIEGIVGLINAWQLSANDLFLEKALAIWKYTQANLLDYEHGEWHWLVTAAGIPDRTMMKAGFWKCPYHNARGCLEALKRLPA
ncbi:AGE family epimerase/isomerase [uncultured Sunxiuqinia sp.]|uniref:AGE family epimerase/isomerase n=1 Tax=uncultured Sunxiuqinia sp. TaxID=1573825 RepID=UPI0026098D24|nr:AGE family epimerase/isomerase [uncultured Sunxiuqinia sp.]